MLSRTHLTVLVALAAAVLAGGALAQAGNPGAPQRGRQARRAAVDVSTVPIAALDAIVTLTPDQKTRISAIQDKLKADEKPLAPARGVPADPTSRQKVRDLRRQATADINAVLTDEQKTKLRQAAPVVTMVRQAGIALQVLADLNLTADQKTSLAAIAKDAQAKTREIPATATPEDRRAKQTTIREEVRTKVTALLTDKQKAVIEQYAKEHPRRGGNRRGGNRGGAGPGTTGGGGTGTTGGTGKP